MATEPLQELSTPEPQSLSEWFVLAHNLDTDSANEQARLMTQFFTGRPITHAPSTQTKKRAEAS